MNRGIIRIAIQGAIIGVGAILPGVSGGVLCVAFGLYGALMEFLTNPKKALKENYKILIPLFVGWVIGFVLLAKVCELCFVVAPDISVMLFFGLVVGTIPEMCKKVGQSKSWLPFVISLCASYMLFHLIEGGEAITLEVNYLTMAFCGVLWGLSMVIPGLSSATLLIYLGLYVPFTEGVATMNLSILFPFGVGVIATVAILARFVDKLYKNHYTVIAQIMLGFVITSSLKTLPHRFTNVWTMIISIACCVIGFIVALIMDRAEHKEG
jgi:putative membrane protein